VQDLYLYLHSGIKVLKVPKQNKFHNKSFLYIIVASLERERRDGYSSTKESLHSSGISKGILYYWFAKD